MHLRPLVRLCLAPLSLWGLAVHPQALAAEPAGTNYVVNAYLVAGYAVPPTNASLALLSQYTGSGVGLEDLVEAAVALQTNYRSRGYTNVSIAFAPDRIAGGRVTLNAFRAPAADILVSGKRVPNPAGVVGRMSQKRSAAAKAGAAGTAGAKAKAEARAKPSPRFNLKAFEIRGDTLLTTEALTAVLAKYTGTDAGLTNIMAAAADLQKEYRTRGYPTVRVAVPQQQITNDMVRLQVFQGRLAAIEVTKNRYFSSNNVMRALPGLHTNMILNSVTFQAELDRANANQDRQIYPQISPGPEENTTLLTLETRDRLPLHAKIELNDQSAPGTPDLRVNSSAVYNNLWQLEHSLGVQYSFSPETYKGGSQWDFYDQPAVANYGAFYRMPLSSPESITEVMAASPGTFGYDEATRTFHLPPPTGVPELNLYASRSSIDSGLMSLFNTNYYNYGTNSLSRQIVQQDLTVNGALGSRLRVPLPGSATFQSTLSGGLDFKTYDLTSNKTNVFTYVYTYLNPQSNPSHPSYITNRLVDPSGATTRRLVEYLPVAVRYEGSLRDPKGVTSFGLGVSANTWFSGTLSNLQNTVGSTHASGYWVAVSPTIGRDLQFHTNWVLSLRLDGQVATEPLLSNEQFGPGGVGGVRGYHEGDVFGDDGWRVTAEQKTPYYVVGTAYRNHPLTVRGSVFMDYGEVYLLDPEGRSVRTPLWGVGFGGSASIGPNWEARLLFSWPLLSAGITVAGQPRFDFGLSAQF